MSSPKISIVIPIYKTGKVIRKTLASIQNQTFSDFECLLIDDGGNDQLTTQICKNITLKDSRFRLFEKKNEGIEKTRLFGVQKSRADLIAFCDHDDYYETHAMMVLYNAYLKYNADIVAANCFSQRFYSNNFGKKLIAPNVLKETIVTKENFITQYFINFFGINKFPVSTWGKLYRKELFLQSEIESFDVNFIEDIVINIQLFERAEIIHFIPNVVYSHIYGGLSSKFNVAKTIDGYDKIYTFRKSILEKYSLDVKPLHIEFKNVINQNIDLMIDNKFNYNQFVKNLNLIKSKKLFDDMDNLLINREKSDYIKKLSNNDFETLYNEAKNKFTIKRKVKLLMKKMVSKL